jgi:hypothetical protein
MLSFRMFSPYQPSPLRPCPSAIVLQICFANKTVASRLLQPQQNHHLHTLVPEAETTHFQGFCFQSLAHSFALFCRPRSCKSFRTNQLRTLAKKHPGWGGGPLAISARQPAASEPIRPSFMETFQLRHNHHPPAQRIHDRVHDPSAHCIAATRRCAQQLICGKEISTGSTSEWEFRRSFNPGGRIG